MNPAARHRQAARRRTARQELVLATLLIAYAGTLAGCIEERVLVRSGISRPGTVAPLAEVQERVARPANSNAESASSEAGGDGFGGTVIGEAGETSGSGAESRAKFALTSLGTVDYDGMSLPRVSPDGRFIALQVGTFEGWVSAVYGEDQRVAGEQPRQPPDLMPKLERSVIVYDISGRQATIMPWCVSGEVAARYGNLTLGRQSDALGVQVEQSMDVTAPAGDESAGAVRVRRIGKLDYLTGSVSWLTGFGSVGGNGLGVAMHGVQLADGRLICSVRDRVVKAVPATPATLSGPGGSAELNEPPIEQAMKYEVSELSGTSLVIIDGQGQRTLMTSASPVAGGSATDHLYVSVLADSQRAVVLSSSKFGLVARVISIADGSVAVPERLVMARGDAGVAGIARAMYLTAAGVPAHLGEHLQLPSDRSSVSNLGLLIDPATSKLLSIDVPGERNESDSSPAGGSDSRLAAVGLLAEGVVGVQLMRLNGRLGVVRSMSDSVTLSSLQAPAGLVHSQGSPMPRWKLQNELTLRKGAGVASGFSQGGRAGCIVVAPPSPAQSDGSSPRYEVLRVEFAGGSR